MNEYTPQSISTTLNEITRRISEKFAPDKIIVFGSYARGGVTPDSDVDILVILHVEHSRRQVATEIERALIGMNVPIDVIVATPEDIEEHKDQVGTIIRPALLEGKVLYEKSA